MSDMTFTAHMLACDWPECHQTTDPGSRDEDWLHTEDGHDYCPKHQHFDDGLDERVPGPDTEDSKKLGEFLMKRRDYERGKTS